jgi:undecaprenyl-diphosphatase
MEQLFEFLDHIDKDLLLYLQSQHTLFLDTIMAGITNKYNWWPLYLLLLVALYRQFGWHAIYSLVAVVVLIILSDQITSSLMKPLFGRFRPCHDPEIGHLVRIVTKCGGFYGFVSGHAANSFAVTTFFLLLFVKTHRYFWWLLIWPLAFSYSRIYLGVHYPLDILGGTLVGIFLGYLVFIGTSKLSLKVPFGFTPDPLRGKSPPRGPIGP